MSGAIVLIPLAEFSAGVPHPRYRSEQEFWAPDINSARWHQEYCGANDAEPRTAAMSPLNTGLTGRRWRNWTRASTDFLPAYPVHKCAQNVPAAEARHSKGTGPPRNAMIFFGFELRVSIENAAKRFVKKNSAGWC
jgi:hypothetical protein